MSKKTDPATVQSELILLYRKALMSGVSLDDLQEKVELHTTRLTVTETFEVGESEEKTEQIRRKLPNFVRVGALILPILFLAVGLYLVGSAVVPILAYYVSTTPQLRSDALLAPIPQDQLLDVTPLVITESDQEESKAAAQPTILSGNLDYTNLSNWFNNASLPNLASQAHADEQVQEYTIDIPTLNITNAVIKVGGSNLDESLIAYPGTAMPGEFGAPVIFGHSVLRQFYNPSEKNPRRYNSIFSTIMTLKPGDKIYVTADGVKYTYLVQDKSEVKPEDVYILNQDFGSKKLKLVTCTPEGTYLRRGVITAQLIQEE
jgi:LPXTG-site transpeptidase (sortase) family protein